MTVNGTTTPKRKQTMQGQVTAKNKSLKSRSAVSTPIPSGPPSPKPRRTHTPKSKSLTLKASPKKDSEPLFSDAQFDDKDDTATTTTATESIASPNHSDHTNAEESDLNSASIATSPTQSLENHESIEQAIKSLEETIKLDQHEHSLRILARQIQRPEYKAEYKNDSDDDYLPTLKKPSARASTVPTKSKMPVGSILKPKSYSYGSPQRSQPINNEPRKSIASIKPPKNLCTCGDADSFWCKVCENRRFKSSFLKWSSGNKILDEIIQETQLNTAGPFNYLEWIPFDRFRNIKSFDEGGYGPLFAATWLDGPRSIQDEKMQAKWKRDARKRVILKYLKNSEHISQKFFNEFAAYYKRIAWDNCMLQCYGISQDPRTKDYVFVLEYSEHGNLRKYLSENAENTSWKLKLAFACDIAKTLKTIHGANLVHRDFHCGNIMITSDVYTAMSDLGLCHPVDDLGKGKVYGVLPYLAPEVINNQKFSKASDVYSFAFVMWEIASCIPPFSDRAHDPELALDICMGLRPKPVGGTPPCYAALMEQCWDPDPSKRPTAESLHRTLHDWAKKVVETPKLPYKVNTEFAVAENWRLRSPSHPSAEPYPKAKYTSQLFDFRKINIPDMEEEDIPLSEHAPSQSSEHELCQSPSERAQSTLSQTPSERAQSALSQTPSERAQSALSQAPSEHAQSELSLSPSENAQSELSLSPLPSDEIINDTDRNSPYEQSIDNAINHKTLPNENHMEIEF